MLFIADVKEAKTFILLMFTSYRPSHCCVFIRNVALGSIISCYCNSGRTFVSSVTLLAQFCRGSTHPECNMAPFQKPHG